MDSVSGTTQSMRKSVTIGFSCCALLLGLGCGDDRVSSKPKASKHRDTDKGERVQDAGEGGTDDVDAAMAAEPDPGPKSRSEEHTSELQSLRHLVCRLLLEKKKANTEHD